MNLDLVDTAGDRIKHRPTRYSKIVCANSAKRRPVAFGFLRFGYLNIYAQRIPIKSIKNITGSEMVPFTVGIDTEKFVPAPIYMPKGETIVALFAILCHVLPAVMY